VLLDKKATHWRADPRPMQTSITIDSGVDCDHDVDGEAHSKDEIGRVLDLNERAGACRGDAVHSSTLVNTKDDHNCNERYCETE